MSDWGLWIALGPCLALIPTAFQARERNWREVGNAIGKIANKKA